MGNRWSSFLKKIASLFGKSHKTKSTEQMNRRETIERFMRNQGYLHGGESIEFVDTEPVDEKSREINKQCHQNEYISHMEHLRIVQITKI
jgi:hypothetical protein